MIRASITPGMARTRFNSPSVSMVAPNILCRRSERRGAPVGAGLREPHFPRRPPGTAASREDPHVSAVRLDPEHLVTSGHCLPRREPEDLAGRSPDFQFLPVLIPKCRHHSLHYDCLLFRQKDVSCPVAVTVAPEEGDRGPEETQSRGYVAPAVPRLSKAFRQVRQAWNSRFEWRYLPEDGNNAHPAPRQ